jgi:hypothetical protein
MKKILYGIISSLALTTSLYSATAFEQLQLSNQKILVDGIISKTKLLGNSIGQYIVNTGGYPTYNSSQDKLIYDNIDGNKIEMYKYTNLTSNYLTKLDGTECNKDTYYSDYCRSTDTQGVNYLVKYDSLNKIPIGISFHPEDILGASTLDLTDDKIIAQLNLNGIVYQSGKLVKYFSDQTLATIKQSYFLLNSNPSLNIKDVSETNASTKNVGDIVYSPDGNGGFLIFIVALDTSGNKYWKAYGEPQVILTADNEDALASINASINDEITVLNPGGIAITYTAQSVTTSDTGDAQTTWQMSNGAFTKNYSDGSNDLLFMTQTNIDYTSKINNTCNYAATSSLMGKLNSETTWNNCNSPDGCLTHSYYDSFNGARRFFYVRMYNNKLQCKSDSNSFSYSFNWTDADSTNGCTSYYYYDGFNGAYSHFYVRIYNNTLQCKSEGYSFHSPFNWTDAGSNGCYASYYHDNFNGAHRDGMVKMSYSCPNGGTLNGTICEKSCTSSYPASGSGDVVLYNGNYKWNLGPKNGYICSYIDGNLCIFASRGDGGFGHVVPAGTGVGGRAFEKVYTWSRSGIHQPETNTFNIGGQTYIITYMRSQASSGGTSRFSMRWKSIIKKGSYSCPSGGILSGTNCIITNPPTSICPDGYVDSGLSGAQACKKIDTTTNCTNSSSCRLTPYNPITNNNEDKYTLILGCEGTNTSLTYKDGSGTNIYKQIGETTTAEIFNKGTYFDINFVEDGLTTTDTTFDPDNFRDGTYFDYKCLVKNNSDY